MRYLILIHRYLGIAVGILMVGWCLTGIVMMYVRYPELSQAQRLRQLPPLDWRGCCQVGTTVLPADAAVAACQLESLAGRPVLQVQFADRGPEFIDLLDGQAISRVSMSQAAAVARGANAQLPRLLGLISYDEWTVAGEFDRSRPLYLFALDDASGTQIYVSARTGRMVQVTSAPQRFWNWLGAVPHWLYFAQLRRHAALWTQVVIWTSLAGCFLTLFGLYLGVRQFLRRPAGRWSVYRGLLYWHHVPGLIFGLFALSWVASGLISMNPWGFLDDAASHPEMDSLLGPPMSGSRVIQELRALGSAALPHGVVAVESGRLWGQPYLVATDSTGARRRLDADGTIDPLKDADWRRIGQTLGTATTAVPALIQAGDSYYYSRPGVQQAFPVRRTVLTDAQRTRFYLDPVTGLPLGVIDGSARGYRWLHRGLHTLDFSAAIRSRPLWDVLMLALLSGVTVLCVTGTWLGWRRYLPTRTPSRER
jgi:hypothetical protein